METVNFRDVQNLQRANAEWRLFKCPYCFKPIGPFSTAFRAVTAYEEQDIDNIDDIGEGVFEKYKVHKDTILEDFWKKYPGSKPEGEDENHAVLHALQSGEGIITNRVFELDNDGFPFAMREPDNAGIVTEKRLCPHCHNQLPHEYGKFPIIFIAVVGITGSGKTVYLSQLMNYIEEYLTKANLVAPGLHDDLAAYVESHTIRKDVPLPIGTLADRLTQPLPINVQDRTTNRKFTLVFYDIAGENCVKPGQMQKFGPFIVNANGILMIIDPKQFAGIFRLPIEDDNITRPERVANAMYNAFLAHVQGDNGKCDIPIAVALSKSDMLRDYFESSYQQSNIFKKIDYSSYNSYRNGNRGLAFEDCRDISDEIKELLEADIQGETLINTISASFDKMAYFAFSALNSTPQKQKDDKGIGVYTLTDIPERIRVEEPFYWLLYKLGIIPAIRRNSSDCTYCDNVSLNSVGGGRVDVQIAPPTNLPLTGGHGGGKGFWPFGNKK